MQLTEHMIIARAKQSDLSTVKRINLWGCELSDISIIRKLSNVEVLALSVNNLSCLKPLESCKKLQELYLRKNNIQDFNELLHLQDLPFLSHLWLAENPCCEAAGASYRARVVKMLPNLKKLDEQLITAEDIGMAKRLDTMPIEPERSAQTLHVEPELPKETISERSFKADKQIQNVQLMQNQSPLPGSPIVLAKKNQKFDKELLSPLPPLLEESFKGDELLSPQQSYSFNNASSFEPIEPNNCVPRFSPPSFHTSRSDSQKLYGQEPKLLRKSNSLSQIAQYPQLNVVLQIEQPQTQQNPMPEPSQYCKSYRSSLQSINERYDQEENQFNQCYQHKSLGSLSNYGDRRSFSSKYSYSRDSLEAYDRRSNRSSMSFNSPNKNSSNEWQYIMDLANKNETMQQPNFNRDFFQEDDFNGGQKSARSSATLITAPVFCAKRRNNVNLLSALLCIVQELDLDSLQVLEHRLQCRMDELSQD